MKLTELEKRKGIETKRAHNQGKEVILWLKDLGYTEQYIREMVSYWFEGDKKWELV